MNCKITLKQQEVDLRHENASCNVKRCQLPISSQSLIVILCRIAPSLTKGEVGGECLTGLQNKPTQILSILLEMGCIRTN